MPDSIEDQLAEAEQRIEQLEEQARGLRAVIGRIGDHVREVPAPREDGRDGDYHFGRGVLRGEILAIVDTAAGPVDLSPLSQTYIGGVRQTWQQQAERFQAQLNALRPALTMLGDLDRSRAGRHEGDVEGGAVSLGNPHLAVGQTIGYTIGGSNAYVVPEPRERGNPAAWLRPRP